VRTAPTLPTRRASDLTLGHHRGQDRHAVMRHRCLLGRRIASGKALRRKGHPGAWTRSRFLGTMAFCEPRMERESPYRNVTATEIDRKSTRLNSSHVKI